MERSGSKTDTFRIMCHGNNTLWAADEVDERLVEKPVAPGGATGGVEFEAMNYVVSLSSYYLLWTSQMRVGELRS